MLSGSFLNKGWKCFLNCNWRIYSLGLRIPSHRSINSWQATSRLLWSWVVRLNRHFDPEVLKGWCRAHADKSAQLYPNFAFQRSRYSFFASLDTFALFQASWKVRDILEADEWCVCSKNHHYAMNSQTKYELLTKFCTMPVASKVFPKVWIMMAYVIYLLTS